MARVATRREDDDPQWVVLSDDDPARDSKLAHHIMRFPAEKEPILDSATSFGGTSRQLPDSLLFHSCWSYILGY
ncbi:hypothetical protein LIPSTDRAFT_108278 [Lipomyces starkeyi NRRL Y-11557]|uniref:Uncharacterized protein n=1 Tax=Lipomyces starkeyi NRRL Y-11557 TaxID=675824 RepID=A0A1E3PU74_LIPST|nr:hypothetical protein LIPSTDRAFT_108278 [Lipomyces starkeyi NRRL Y-11557]